MTLALAATTSDAELLRCYAEEHSEAAFTELVRRHLDLVHSAALRQVGGNTTAAADVTQSVFVELARQASRLRRHPALVGWLFTTAHRLASRQVRAEVRRQRREREAYDMQEQPCAGEALPDWEHLAPALDAAMHELRETDRLALLLRHFEQRSFIEVGDRLGLSENAARMRVERALEKLRLRLARRGITSTASALALVLGNSTVAAAPAGLAANVAAAALTTAALGTASIGLFTLMTSAKLKLTVVLAGLGLLTATVFVQREQARQLREQQQVLERQLVGVRADLEAMERAKARAIEDLNRSSYSREELLRLRGEVARLRRAVGRSVASAPGSAAQPSDAPTPSATFSAQVHTQITSGHTVVAGGWDWVEGRRGLLFMTPVTRHADDGNSVVEVESRVLLVPEPKLAKFGLSQFGSQPLDPDAHAVLPPEQVKRLLDELQSQKDIEILQTARMTTGNGQQAAVGISNDDLADVVVVEILPQLLTDGRIDVTATGRLEPRPR